MISPLETDLYPKNMLSRIDQLEHYTRFLLERSGVSSGTTTDVTSNVYRVTAGQGLVGGGTGDVTINVGGGTGLIVSADAVAVDVAGLADDLHGIEESSNQFRIKIGARAQINFLSGGLILDDQLPGSGLAYNGSWQLVHDAGDIGDVHPNYPEHDQVETISGAWTHTAALALRGAALQLRTAAGAGTAALQPNGDGTIAVVAGSGLHPAADGTLDLGAASARWGETHLGELRSYNAAGTKNVLLRHDDAQAELIASSGLLRLESVEGDVVVQAGGKDVLPLNNYDLNLGLINKKWLTLHAAELWVETLVAQDTIATIGGRILVGPTTVLTSDLSAAASTITVKHNQMSVGDRIYMEAEGKVEFMAVTGGPTGAGPYTYTVTRDLDGSFSNDWYAGDAVFNTGQAGDGFIDLYSIAGVKSGTFGPTIVGNVRNSATYNDWTEHWAIGNLNGLYGYGADTFGVGIGKRTDNHIVIDEANGIRFRSNTAVLGQLSSSQWTLGQAGEARVEITPTAVNLYDGAATPAARVSLDSAGLVRVGKSGEARVEISDTAINIFNGAATPVSQLLLNATGIALRDTAGVSVFVLDTSGNYFALPVTLGTSGGIWQGTGTFASPIQGIKMYNSGGYGAIAGYSASLEQVRIGTDGKLWAGVDKVSLARNGLWLTPQGQNVIGIGGTGHVNFGNPVTQTLQAAVGGVYTDADTYDVKMIISSALHLTLSRNGTNYTAELEASGGITLTGPVNVSGNLSVASSLSVGTSLHVWGAATVDSAVEAVGGYTSGSGDIRVARGVFAGAISVNPGTGNIVASRASGGYFGVYDTGGTIRLGRIYVPLTDNVAIYNNTPKASAGSEWKSHSALGVPADAIAIVIRLAISSVTAGALVYCSPVSSDPERALFVRCPTSTIIGDGMGVVTLHSTSGLYVNWNAACSLWGYVTGYFI